MRFSVEATTLTIEGHASDDSPSIGWLLNSISGLARTTAARIWSVDPWPNVQESSAAQASPDLAAIVQELVDRPGWNETSALTLILSGTGKRVAESFDGDTSGAARLVVEYQGPAQRNSAPEVTFVQDVLAREGDSVRLVLGANDIDGDRLAWQVENLPPGLSLDGKRGEIVGRLPLGSVGLYPIVVRVSDGRRQHRTALDLLVVENPDLLSFDDFEMGDLTAWG